LDRLATPRPRVISEIFWNRSKVVSRSRLPLRRS
jgi:hypothetical protein